MSFWAPLGTSWAPLGSLLGPLGRLLEASWGVLEASWGPPGASKRPKTPHDASKTAQQAPKMPPRPPRGLQRHLSTPPIPFQDAQKFKPRKLPQHFQLLQPFFKFLRSRIPLRPRFEASQPHKHLQFVNPLQHRLCKCSSRLSMNVGTCKKRLNTYVKHAISPLERDMNSLDKPLQLARRNARSDPPPNRGRRAEPFDPGLLVLPSPSSWTKFLTQRFKCWEPGLLSYPSLILPRRPAHSAGPTQLYPGIRLLAPLGPKKSPSKRPSKTDQILMPFQHRFLNVLVPFWRGKMAPKSIKNQ